MDSIAVLIILAATLPDVLLDNNTKADEAVLQGEWTIERIEFPSLDWFKDVKGSPLVFARGKIISKGDLVTSIAYRIDAAKKPKQIDIVINYKDKRESTLKGIYQLDKDTLRMLFSTGDKDRPYEMREKPMPGAEFLIVMKRAK